MLFRELEHSIIRVGGVLIPLRCAAKFILPRKGNLGILGAVSFFFFFGASALGFVAITSDLGLLFELFGCSVRHMYIDVHSPRPMK